MATIMHLIQADYTCHADLHCNISGFDNIYNIYSIDIYILPVQFINIFNNFAILNHFHSFKYSYITFIDVSFGWHSHFFKALRLLLYMLHIYLHDNT